MMVHLGSRIWPDELCNLHVPQAHEPGTLVVPGLFPHFSVKEKHEHSSPASPEVGLELAPEPEHPPAGSSSHSGAHISCTHTETVSLTGVLSSMQ